MSFAAPENDTTTPNPEGRTWELVAFDAINPGQKLLCIGRLACAGPARVNGYANLGFERRQTALRCRPVTTMAYVLAPGWRLLPARL
jgi:hypothetical protein